MGCLFKINYGKVESCLMVNDIENGCLYIVSTPIGNLNDITIRALDILKNVDIIAAEDTRHTLKLLNHFSIKKTLISYHEHNKYKVDDKLISKLNEGKNIALVSDAGTPGISDPGEDIIRKAIDKGINVIPIPGPSALVTAVIISGLKTDRFVFEGFLPPKKTDRKKLIEFLKKENRTIILYESPHSLKNTIQELYQILGNRKIAILRELTKIHEEAIRGTFEEVLNLIEEKRLKGEMVIVIEGKENSYDDEESKGLNLLCIEEHFNEYIKLGNDKKEAMKKVANDRGVSKKDIYNILFKK